MRDKLADLPQATILQLIYQQKSYEGNARDYEFSADSMHEHWKNGHEDTKRTLKRKDWLEMPPPNYRHRHPRHPSGPRRTGLVRRRHAVSPIHKYRPHRACLT